MEMVVEFVVPPLLFLVFHLLLHAVSRLGLTKPAWLLLNAGVHLAVIAASVQFVTTMYYIKLVTGTATPEVHRLTVDAAIRPAFLFFFGAIVVGIFIALLDRALHIRYQKAAKSKSSQRKTVTLQALGVLMPTVLGFVLFGVIALKILRVGLMPDV